MLLLASFKLDLRSLDSLTKSSQVSRAKGTTHAHQSGVLNERGFSFRPHQTRWSLVSVSLPWTWQLLLASFKLDLRSLDSLTKSSQVSRAKGTTHAHQSGVLNERGFFLRRRPSEWCWCVVSVSLPWIWQLLLASFKLDLIGHWTASQSLHKSLGPKEPLM